MKIALLADLHIGVKKSDKIFQESQFRFLEEQFVPELKERCIDTVVILGDLFDTRQAVNTNTMNSVLKLFKEVLADFDVHVIVGNHDLYYTTTTEVNSLKWLNLLDNVHVYEKPTRVTFGTGKDSKEVLMLPWVVDYKAFADWNVHSEYLFAHLDISGMRMDKYSYCSYGSTIEKLLERFDHVYTGHFHTRSTKSVGNKDITYIGSPYQITRMDSGDARGYTILELADNTTEFIRNTKSIEFKQAMFPDQIPDISTFTHGNVIDVLVKYEDSKYSKKIYEYTKSFEQYGPAYPVNIKILQRSDVVKIDTNLTGINLMELIKEYIDTNEHIPKEYKQIVYSRIVKLYTEYKV